MSHRIFRPSFGGTRPVRISNRPTYLPNASTTGFGQYRASPGDVVCFEDGSDHGWGRVVGRITSHLDSLDYYRGFLVVVTVGSTKAFGAVRWIDPKTVTLCQAVNHARDFLVRLLSADTAHLTRYAETCDSRDLLMGARDATP